MFFSPNSMKFKMDRPVEKMHVKELKEILFRKKVSLKEVNSVSNPLFYMIKYT